MRELFVEKVIDTTESFLDNDQRIKLKEILTEICLNYQIERIEQTKKQKILKNNTDILNKFISSKEIEGCSTNNEALVVSLIKPYNRLEISGIEILIRNLRKEANINKVHPHKFRRTMATMAIDKGMPIEQVQKLLGHIRIDTTMEYAMVNQNNVKNSHRKFIT